MTTGRHIGKLTATQVRREKRPGMYNDGGGLNLQVTSATAKSWIFRYGERWMGLGSAFTTTLAEARDAAHDLRKLLQQGVDPLEAKRTRKAKVKLEAAKAITFKQCAAAFIEAHSPGWKNAKHLSQWRTTIEQYCGAINDLPVAAVDTDGVLAVLQPIWTTASVTASRLRGRIESVLAWATVRNYRAGPNPATWRNHLDQLLPRTSKVSKVVHHRALPYAEIPAFMEKLRKREGLSARALELCVLTAARSGEVFGARREEFDLAAAVWTVPGNRMKSGKTHRVPLSAPALEIVAALPGEMPFGLSSKAMARVMEQIGAAGTVHGLRSSFRDFCAERTNFPREVVEQALAHSIGNKAEVAYKRTDFLERRRDLMNVWARFCGGESKVLPMRVATN